MANELNGSTWNEWKTLAMTVSSDPSCASDGGGKVICAATATSGNLQVSIFNAPPGVRRLRSQRLCFRRRVALNTSSAKCCVPLATQMGESHDPCLTARPGALLQTLRRLSSRYSPP